MSTTTISPQARIIALLGVLLIGLGGSSMFLLSRQHAPEVVGTSPVTQPTHTGVHVVPPTVDPLIPAPLHQALERYPVVVVGFYNPDSAGTDRTITEARAGAAAAGVGFVSVSVLNDAVAGPLTALLPTGEILPNPGIAIYGRPGTLLYRSDGYASRVEVAQAVKESR